MHHKTYVPFAVILKLAFNIYALQEQHFFKVGVSHRYLNTSNINDYVLREHTWLNHDHQDLTFIF